jgi:hypothetical protein
MKKYIIALAVVLIGGNDAVTAVIDTWLFVAPRPAS